MYCTCAVQVSSQDRFRLGTYLVKTSKRIRTTGATAALTSAPSSNLQQHPRIGIKGFVNYCYALDYSHVCLSLRTFSKSCKGFSTSSVISHCFSLTWRIILLIAKFEPCRLNFKNATSFSAVLRCIGRKQWFPNRH